MAKYTIEYLKENNLIIYEYRRGSHAYNLATPTSDEDLGGVFVCPKEDLMGLPSKYVEQVSDEKNDVVYYELGRWIELLLKSNPTMIESLFVPDDCVIKTHPIIEEIKKHRDMFLSKEVYKTHFFYAQSQIGRARGLNKKIVNEITERKDILDFCFTFKGQGSQPIKDYLKERGLDQRYCGLVNIPNMPGVFGVYYDFAAYFKFENVVDETSYQDMLKAIRKAGIDDSKIDALMLDIQKRIEEKKFFGYSGIVHPDEIEKSNEVRLSSIPKGEMPICFMTYNKDGYASHCRDYKSYKEWEKNRNPVRYESNLNKNYDAKNIMHCMRLVRMAKELAQGKGFNVKRVEDRDYLLSIRNHKFEYDDIMAQVNNEVKEMEEAMKTTTLPDHIDYDAVNQLLIAMRNAYYSNLNNIHV